MVDSDLKVLIQPPDFDFRYRVYIYYDHGDYRLHCMADGSKGKRVEYGSREEIEPTFILDRDMVQPLLEAFLAMGVRPDKESVVEGKYEAQGRHLEDLRTLLKLRSRE